MPEAAEWRLRPSRQQFWLNLLAGGLLCLFTALVAPVLIPLACGLTLVLIRHSWRVQRLGVDHQGWWLDRGKGREYVSWCAGSIRRRHLLVLNWSWMPWDSLLIRADSMAGDDDFRRLKAALDHSWH